MPNNIPTISSLMAKQGIYVFLWQPAFKIGYKSYDAMKLSLIKNAAAGAIGKGPTHKSQGHAMVSVHKYTGLTQNFYGKTTSEQRSKTEDLWLDTMLGDKSPPKGLRQLKMHGSPAYYQPHAELKKDLKYYEKTGEGNLEIWYAQVDRPAAEAAVDWINVSDQKGYRSPRTRAWGFDRGCTNWVHGVLMAAGFFASRFECYQTAYVHKNCWETGDVSLLKAEPWKMEQGGSYQHPIRFLTPKIFRRALKKKGLIKLH